MMISTFTSLGPRLEEPRAVDAFEAAHAHGQRGLRGGVVGGRLPFFKLRERAEAPVRALGLRLPRVGAFRCLEALPLVVAQGPQPRCRGRRRGRRGGLAL